MASSQTAPENSTSTNEKDKTGSKEGKVYEKLSLSLLAKNGYELSKRSSKFHDFYIGREVGLGAEGKFDDNVFRYRDEDDTKQLIFVQVKHKQHDRPIDSEALSAEAATSKGGGDGGMRRDFNLQKYFISYISVREELKKKNISKECRGGKIKWVAIFTNVGLDREELERKGFSLREAPDEVTNFFTLRTQEPENCYQLSQISEDLRKILLKSSDLHRVARELAQYVVWENHRENKIMGIDAAPMKHYHVPLAKQVIRKSDEVETISSKKKKERYSEAQFREDFLEKNEIWIKQLRDAVYGSIRELDDSKKSWCDEKLKNHLKGIKWKAVPNFGKTKKNKEIVLPSGWTTLKKEDITDFLNCLVFAVNRPRVNELQALILRSVQDTVLDRHYSTLLNEVIDKLQNVGPEFSGHIQQDLAIYNTTSFKEKWTSGGKIVKFLDEKKQQISKSFFVPAMTFIYEGEVMQCGKFNESEKIEKCLDEFFSNNVQILCINSPQTLLSSNKILHYLNSKKDYIAEGGRIYANFDILKSKENRDSLASAFELERNVLLVIEHRHAVSERDVEEFYKKVYSVVSAEPNKKIIIIITEDEQNNLLDKFQNEDNFMMEYDVIDVKCFEPKEDPFKKKVILFQGQHKKVSLCDITGIDSWTSYVDSSFQGTNGEDVMDGMTLVKILNNDEMKMGSKPAGTSTLEGAYAQMYEEINVETLVDRLTSRGHGHDANDVYVISGISGSSKLDKKNKLIQYLGLSNKKEVIEDQLGDVGSDKKIQIADGQFKHKDFQNLCHNCSEKHIFWISVEDKVDVKKLILQETYNPKFYLKRIFQIFYKKIIFIKKDLKEHIIRDDLSEKFIFYCVENKQELYKSMELNKLEIKKFENNSKIRIFIQKCDAEAAFRELRTRNETVHFFEFKENQFVWSESHDSLENLQKYIDHDRSELQTFGQVSGKSFLIQEDKLIEKMKDRKVVIFADDPGMGKTTTLIKSYETEIESSSIIKSHWVINIKLRDHLETFLDHEFEKDGIGILDIIEFLSTVDLSLNNNLAKNLLKIVLDKSKCFQAKPLLLNFDGFDEVLDEVCRHRIVMLLQFLKDETAAKLWITTRCHFQKLLEEKLSTIAIQFSPMDDAESAQYIATYLRHRLYLILNNDKYIDLFDTEDENQIDGKIHTYAAAFINKMKSIFRGDISTFIGTPLQLYLMLEGAVTDFKIWIEGGDDKISLLEYVRNDVWDIYEYFINKKYDIYFLKIGIRERARLAREKEHIDRDHKDFAVSKILKENAKSNFEQFKDIFLLVGVIKSEGNGMEFIHKTFEEFFVSKACIDSIKKPQKTDEQEFLCTVILLKPDYQLVRTFIDFQLQKLKEQCTGGEGQHDLNENFKYYGETLAKLLSKENSPLIDVNGTPLHIAVKEKNKNIVWFLLKSLEGHPVALRKFLFTVGSLTDVKAVKYKGTALHLACWGGDVEIVKVLLDKERIPEDTSQEFLKCLDDEERNALLIAAIKSDQMFKELWERANNKLDLILTDRDSALCVTCLCNQEELVDFLLQEFQHEKHSLKKLLLHNGKFGNALYYAYSINTVKKLIAAAKSIEDNNETLKNMLLPEKGIPPLNDAVSQNNKAKFEKLLNAAREIDDDNQTLIHMLLNERYKTTPLHVAAERGRGDFIKLLLETASGLGMEILEKLITAVDSNDRNAIHTMIERGHEAMFDDAFKMLDEDKYGNIRKKVMEMYDSVPLESRLEQTKEKLLRAIDSGNIKTIKYILSNARNSRINPNESLRILLLANGMFGNTLELACEQGNSKIIKILLFYAVHMEDEGATLNELLTSFYGITPIFDYIKYTRKIKQIVENLIFEARIFSRDHAVNILEHINNQNTVVEFSSEKLDDTSDESDDTSDESDDTSDESDDTSDESEDTSDESEDTSDESDAISKGSDDISEESDDISEESDSLEESDGISKESEAISEESDDISEESDDRLEESDEISEESGEIFKVLYDSSEEMACEENVP